MGLGAADVNGAIRFSFGVDITKGDIDFVVRTLTNAVNELREMSPLTKKSKKGEE